VFDVNDGVEYTASKGTLHGNQINLSVSDTREFEIIMTKKALAK
jgi:hypothetical protein